MEFGSDWTAVNIGVRLRQRRSGVWGYPDTLSASRVGFGLCSGTNNPFGSAAPTYFVGVRTKAAWTRNGIFNWWVTGWDVITANTANTTTHQTGNDSTLRVSETDDDECSAWYARLTKVGEDRIRLDLFLPSGRNAPTEDDFLTQLDRDQWNTSVNNHDTYRNVEFMLSRQETQFGVLNAVNIFSNVPNYAGGQLQGIEWVSARAVRLD